MYTRKEKFLSILHLCHAIVVRAVNGKRLENGVSFLGVTKTFLYQSPSQTCSATQANFRITDRKNISLVVMHLRGEADQSPPYFFFLFFLLLLLLLLLPPPPPPPLSITSILYLSMNKTSPISSFLRLSFHFDFLPRFSSLFDVLQSLNEPFYSGLSHLKLSLIPFSMFPLLASIFTE